MEAFKNTSPLSVLKLVAVVLIVQAAAAVGNTVSPEVGSMAFFGAVAVCVVVAVVLGIRDRVSGSATPILQVALLAASVIAASAFGIVGVLRRRKSQDKATALDQEQVEPGQPQETSEPQQVEVASDAKGEREPAEETNATEEVSTRRKRDVAKAAALKAATVITKMLPGILWQSFLGALKYAALSAGAGLLLAVGVWAIDRQNIYPQWLHLLQVFLIPALLLAAGFYIGAFRGFLEGLSFSLRMQGTVEHFYSLCKPIAMGVVASLNTKVSPNKKELLRSVHRQSRELFVAGTERATDAGAALSERGSTIRLGVFERVQQKLSNSIAQRLCVIVLMPSSDQDRANIVAEYEGLSLSAVQTKLDDVIHGLFSTQQLLVGVGAVVLITVPYALVFIFA